MILQSMAIEMPRCDYHPNRVPFHGVLTLVDVASDKPPAGARGHRVLMTRQAAEAALPSLLGMGLDYAPTLDRHDVRRKVGIITSAEITPKRPARVEQAFRPAKREAQEAPALAAEGRPSRPANTSGAKAQMNLSASNAGLKPCATLEVTGYLFARDFPEVVREIRAGGRHALGMSYEIADAHIADLRAGIWELTQFTFTGAAVLRRDKAAYHGTWIGLQEFNQ
jgi:hypothetical protein